MRDINQSVLGVCGVFEERQVKTFHVWRVVKFKSSW
jgi:hypothetical protein